jgi:hypothetical protein
MALVTVFTPQSESELITVVAMLEAYNVPCFVQNAGFGSLYPGPKIYAYNARHIMVAEEAVAVAQEFLTDFQTTPIETNPPKAGGIEKLRMGLEALLFGWFMPERRRSKREND